MSARLRCFLLSTVILMTVPAAFGDITIVNFDFGAVGIACGYGYTYEFPLGLCPFDNPTQNFNSSPGFGWILGWILARSDKPDLHGGAGLTGPGTRFDPPSFNGLPFNQAVFLQNGGSFVWQTVGGFTAGSYILSFYLGSRYDSGQYDGNQTVVALIDGNVIGTWALTSFTPFTLETASFTVSTGGSHTLQFSGMNNGDHTAFLSYVVITPTDRPEP